MAYSVSWCVSNSQVGVVKWNEADWAKMRIFVQTNGILIKHKNTMRSFDKANCRQGVVSPVLAQFGIRSGPGISGNNFIRCAKNTDRWWWWWTIRLLRSSSPSSEPPPSLFVFSVAPEPGGVEWGLYWVVWQRSSSQDTLNLLTSHCCENKTQLLSWTILLSPDCANK